jgi:hypothetical protein
MEGPVVKWGWGSGPSWSEGLVRCDGRWVVASRRRLRLICADCAAGQSRMTVVRRELPPSRSASRADLKIGRRIVATRALRSWPPAAVGPQQELDPESPGRGPLRALGRNDESAPLGDDHSGRSAGRPRAGPDPLPGDRRGPGPEPPPRDDRAASRRPRVPGGAGHHRAPSPGSGGVRSVPAGYHSTRLRCGGGASGSSSSRIWSRRTAGASPCRASRAAGAGSSSPSTRWFG